MYISPTCSSAEIKYPLGGDAVSSLVYVRMRVLSSETEAGRGAA